MLGYNIGDEGKVMSVQGKISQFTPSQETWSSYAERLGCKNVYHLRAVQRSYTFKASYSNPEIRIDSRLTDTNQKNFLFNSEILHVLVEAVLTCARQKVALQGHKQVKIDLSKPQCFNEGNFIAILRLLAKTNSTLQAHL